MKVVTMALDDEKYISRYNLCGKEVLTLQSVICHITIDYILSHQWARWLYRSQSLDQGLYNQPVGKCCA